MAEVSKPKWNEVVQLLKQRELIGISIGQFAIASTLSFFLTWFPTYLVNDKHMTILHAGFNAMIPYIAAFIGVLFGGAVSDTLLRNSAIELQFLAIWVCEGILF